MIEKFCPKCKVPIMGDKCSKKGCGCSAVTSSTIYWCKKCNIPVFEKECPTCGTECEYIATDIRPVFPEEATLLGIILKDQFDFFAKNSIWFGSNAYIVDGEKLKVSVSKLNKMPIDKVREIKDKWIRSALVIWIAHTSELLQQAYDTFKGVWKNIGNGSINMYKLWGDYNIEDDVDLNGFMVCGIQKLQSINNNDPELLNKLISNARLIVYDEAHKASAPETRQVVEKFMVRSENSEDRALMGLSATPGKTTEDSFDNQLLVSMFGNKIIEIDTKLMNAVNMSAQEAINTPAEKDVIRYFQNRGVLSKIKKEELVYEEGLSDAEINKIRIVASMLKS